MPDSTRVILVTGATGQQGGAAMRHLVRGGWAVRALVRNPEGDKANALKQAGAELVKGDLYDRPSVDAALKGVHGVFSVQNYWLPDVGFDGEVRQGKLLADAASAAGVSHFLYSSVGAAHRGMGQRHFESKWIIEQHVHKTGLPFTILRPAYFMENTFWQKPAISNGTFGGMGLDPAKTLQMVAVDDIGAFTALVFARPKDYLGRTIELSGDELTEPQVAEALSRVIGREVKIAPRQGGGPSNDEMKAMREFFSGKAYDADIPALRKVHPGLHTFEGWLKETGWERLPVLPLPAQAGWGRS
jgi:uncharacterized protein YbjT (DUF2867 family)